VLIITSSSADQNNKPVPKTAPIELVILFTWTTTHNRWTIIQLKNNFRYQYRLLHAMLHYIKLCNKILHIQVIMFKQHSSYCHSSLLLRILAAGKKTLCTTAQWLVINQISMTHNYSSAEIHK